jgi:hypothetical protein
LTRHFVRLCRCLISTVPRASERRNIRLAHIVAPQGFCTRGSILHILRGVISLGRMGQ